MKTIRTSKQKKTVKNSRTKTVATKRRVAAGENSRPLTGSAAGKWTLFWDMHSGGGQKEPYAHIYIEAPEDEARRIFYARFKHNPERVTCTCCGEDYSISESASLEEATAYHRGCEWNKALNGYDLTSGKETLEQYIARPDVKVIRVGDIKESDRHVELPQEGYVLV